MIEIYRLLRSSLGILFILLFMISNSILCNAQLFSAYEQAYGPWNVQLYKPVLSRRRWYLSTLDNYESGTRSEKIKREDGDLQLIFPEKERLVQRNTTTKSVSSVSCVLNLEKNGKFSLILSENDRGSSADKNAQSIKFECNNVIGNSTLITTDQHQQPLQGEWFLTPNPYCITDRHYDTLLLVSEPRVRMRHDRHHSTKIREKATVELRCKVWGRYSGGAIRRAMGFKHGRIRGRMSHGTILIVKEKEEVDNGNKKRRILITREIVGTFDGRALVESEIFHESDEVHDLDHDSVDEDEREDHIDVEEFDGLL